jgi:hypothetical protein
VDHHDVRQWRLHAPGTQVRPGDAVHLLNETWDGALTVTVDDAGGATLTAPGTDGPTVSLSRPGPSTDPVRGGERVAVRLPGAGYLAAEETRTGAAGPDLTVRTDRAAEWIVTGVAPGVAIPVDRPVALFDTVQGDHLICRPGPGGAALTWASGGTAEGTGLPMPERFRPPEGVPGDTELNGAAVPVRDGDPAAGLLILLDPGEARHLGEHLRERVPDRADLLVPDGAVGAVACRWSVDGGPPAAEALPAPGARIWVQGRLAAEPGVSLHPVRAFAWATDADGDAVGAAPQDPLWPETVLTWRVHLLPGSGAATAVYLPLPGRDGEPGTSTTFTPLPVPDTGGGEPPRPRPPAVVRDPRTGRRAARPLLLPDPAGAAVTRGCTVRVHLPG